MLIQLLTVTVIVFGAHTNKYIIVKMIKYAIFSKGCPYFHNATVKLS